MAAIDPQTQAFLDVVNAEGNPHLYELPVADARESLLQMTLQMDAEPCEVRERKELTIPGPAGEIPIRIYWPEVDAEAEAGGEDRGLGILLLYHGGGFVLGDLDTHENMARYYCNHAQLIVINVDYRLSPEHKFPLGVEDCYTVLCWLAANAQDLGADANRIAVTGDSAGGNLSAVVCQLASSRGGPKVAYQVLAYPVASMDMNASYESRDNFGQGEYLLSMMDMSWFSDLYFTKPKEEIEDLRASPILLEDFSELPPALVITAGYDPLRDEGKHYADKLKDAGVDVEYVCFETTIHGFMSFSGAIDAGKDALELAARKLRENLNC